MGDMELNPLLPKNYGLTSSSSSSSSRCDVLFRDEFNVVSLRLIDDWLDGVFWRPDDVNEFVSFCRMFRELERAQTELEDKYFPEKREERAAEAARETADEETQRYRLFYVELMRRQEEREVFSFKKLFLGCFGFARNRKEDD